MLKILKWAGLSLAGLLVVAVAGAWIASEVILRRKVEVPLPVIRASTDPAAVARGEHLAVIYGCSGCHEKGLTGSKWQDDFWSGRLYTSNLTRAMPRYTDAQLARAIKGGVKADGSPLWGMPSESWIDVTDAEMADLLAWLRTHPPTGAETPPMRVGPLGRLHLLQGKIKPTTDYVIEARAMPSFDAGPAFARGRHLAATVCSECHGSDLKGRPGDTPDLLMAAAYDLPLFTRLMRTGIGMDDKEHGLMTEVARGRFVHMTEQEVTDLHAYLTERAKRAI